MLPEKIEYRCRSCGRLFDTLGDMQRHIVVEHLQKGEFIEETERSEAA